MIQATLEWKPKAKDRPRFVRATGRTYTPKATLEAEAALAAQWREQELPKFDGPIDMQVDLTNDHVFVTITACDDYQERKLRGDVDNYLKLVSDALNGVAYDDDRQIVSITGVKQ